MKALKRKIGDFVRHVKDFPLRWKESIRPAELQKAEKIALELCNKLNAWGVNATLTFEEEQYAVVENSGSPIRWVRVMYSVDFIPDNPGSCVTNLVIPEFRPLPRVEIVARPTRGWRGILDEFGRPTYVRWEGNDNGIGLIKNKALESAILKARGFTHIKLQTCPYHSSDCWEIIPENRDLPEENPIKKQKQWRSCENIAACLLTIIIPK
jgi:hypothetical protein